MRMVTNDTSSVANEIEQRATTVLADLGYAPVEATMTDEPIGDGYAKQNVLAVSEEYDVVRAELEDHEDVLVAFPGNGEGYVCPTQ